MSWIEDVRIRRFYRRRLRPAVRRMRDRGVEFFPLGPDPEETTWWVESPDEPEFLEVGDAGLAAPLARHWERAGLGELAEVAEPLVQLAEDLAETAEASAELSPFIYVMY